MKLQVASFSEVGPRAQNEDLTYLGLEDWGGIFAIADGLGGHGGGRTAAEIALRTIEKLGASDLLAAQSEAHHRILAAQATSDFKEMASTATSVKLINHRLYGVHSGDTRCILQRGRGIKKLTVLHSEAQRLFEAGKLTKSEFLHYPRRNIVESALGMRGDPAIQTFETDLLKGDRIVLSTDGVHEKIMLREMLPLMAGESSEKIASALKSAVEETGPSDNYSAIVIVVDE